MSNQHFFLYNFLYIIILFVKNIIIFLTQEKVVDMKKVITYITIVLIVILVSILTYSYIKSKKTVKPLRGTFVIEKFCKGYL